tara:strand:+ start:509 stop:649 length:141 start_codon:yes stop_codon:yes gene_type:complete
MSSLGGLFKILNDMKTIKDINQERRKHYGKKKKKKVKNAKSSNKHK